MLLSLLISAAYATHVPTYEQDNLRTTGPLAGMESLVVEPAAFLKEVKPLANPPGAGVEKLKNEAGDAPDILKFTNPMSNWAWVTVNGIKVGTINPYGTITFTGLPSGWYQLDLAQPTGFVRHFAVRVGPPPPPPPPPVVDTDGDGFLDPKDRCPNEPETFNNFNDRDGCPDEVPVAVRKFAGTVRGINFETGKTTILRSSEATLKEALKIFKQHPDLQIEIQGHTDSEGDDASNLKLSQGRADAVRQWFIDHGIPAERLTAVGYGETMPIVPNDSPENMAQNRRVEFKISQPDPAPAAPVVPPKPR
jgi:outer membrane protein OmpA-like peptidoglycan-associated protein